MVSCRIAASGVLIETEGDVSFGGACACCVCHSAVESLLRMSTCSCSERDRTELRLGVGL